jgi:hypothetical protein
MSRLLLLCACLAPLFVGTSRAGERIELVYREGVEISLTRKETMRIALESQSFLVDGEEVPPDEMEEDEGEASTTIETILRSRDRVLASEQGRPTRVRREFEELSEKTLEDGEESERTGPLEGRALLLDEDAGEVKVELEGDGEEVDEQYLEGHRLTDPIEALLPQEEVAIGDSWEVEDAALRELFGIDASGPTLFEDDEGEEAHPFDALEDGSTVTADVEFTAIEEHDGLRCAVLAFTYELQAETDARGEFAKVFDLEMHGEGRLWWSLAEARPVAMEHDFEGTLEVRSGIRLEMEEEEEKETVLDSTMASSIEGQGSSEWSVTE